MRYIYENVELIRQNRGISKKKLAENANISNMACTRMLSGQSKMPADILRSFATTLFVDDYNIFFVDKLTDLVMSNK